VPSSAWRAAEILSAVEAAGQSDAAELREAYETVIGDTDDGTGGCSGASDSRRFR
jgi:hypothetical protein